MPHPCFHYVLQVYWEVAEIQLKKEHIKTLLAWDKTEAIFLRVRATKWQLLFYEICFQMFWF